MKSASQPVRLITLALMVVAIAMTPGQSLAGDKKIGWNIDRAATLMSAVDKINESRSGTSHMPSVLSGLGITRYEQFNNRFKEDIDFLMAMSNSHIYIAFKGTQGDEPANKALNKDGRPIRPVKHLSAVVHRGWWWAARKAYFEEIKPFLDEHAARRKILVTGHSQGGAIAAYVAKRIQLDRDYENHPLRLVTFGAPRYTNDKRFFRLGKDVDFWVFTVETAKKNKCVDDTVYAWQKSLPVFKLTAPLDKSGDKVWHGRCHTNHTTYSAAHSLNNYIKLARKPYCEHIALKRDCKATKKALRRAQN